MPFDKSSQKAGHLTFFTAVDYLKHSLSEKDLEYLYKQQVIGLDPKRRIILKAEEASSMPSSQSNKLLDLVNREIIKRDWAGGITFRFVKPSCESHSPYKELLFLPRDLVSMTLPHSRMEGNEYSRVDGKRKLILLAAQSVGLPYGVYARLILMFLTTERIRSKDRRFELKASWRAFLKKLQLPWNGEKYRAIQNQLERLCGTTFIVRCTDKRNKKLTNMLISDQWFQSPDGVQVTFSESFYDMTGSAVIPLETDIVYKLKRSPLTLDLYAWLTYRTTNLDKETFIPWHTLQPQFGATYKRLCDFRKKFRASLRAVLKLKPITPLVEDRKYGLLLSPGSAADVEWVERQMARAVSTTRFPVLI